MLRLCFGFASGALSAQICVGQGTGHHGLARLGRAGARSTYIDYFGLHVFLSSLVLNY